MSTRVPDCAHCGKPLRGKRAGATIIQYSGIKGHPKVGWHMGDEKAEPPRPDCSDLDELSRQLTAISREQREAAAKGLPDIDRRPEIAALLRKIDSRGEGRIIAGKGWQVTVKPAPTNTSTPIGSTKSASVEAAPVDPPRCKVPGCTATDGIWNGEECDRHRRERLEREAAAVGMARCLFLKQRPNEWLRGYGANPDGFARWAASQRENKWDRGRSDGQLRAEWRRIKARVEREAGDRGWYCAWYCARGHDDTPRAFRDKPDHEPGILVARDDLGPLAPTERGFPIASSPIYCIHQRVCRDYVGTEAALVHLAKRPRGTA